VEIVIKTQNIKLNRALEDFIERRIGELEKFFQKKPSKSFVEIGKTTHHHKKGPFFRAECQITVPGKKSIRAEALSPDLRLAIVEVKDEIQRQLKKYEDKFIAKTRKRQRKLKKIIRKQ
jgi:putative sigma-54 modulation protein